MLLTSISAIADSADDIEGVVDELDFSGASIVLVSVPGTRGVFGMGLF